MSNYNSVKRAQGKKFFYNNSLSQLAATWISPAAIIKSFEATQNIKIIRCNIPAECGRDSLIFYSCVTLLCATLPLVNFLCKYFSMESFFLIDANKSSNAEALFKVYFSVNIINFTTWRSSRFYRVVNEQNWPHRRKDGEYWFVGAEESVEFHRKKQNIGFCYSKLKKFNQCNEWKCWGFSFFSWDSILKVTADQLAMVEI